MKPRPNWWSLSGCCIQTRLANQAKAKYWPLTQGGYGIGPQYTHPSKAPVTMALKPAGHLASGRTHFLIHGDSITHPGDAFEGCM